MLILTRRVGWKIRISNDIIVVVLGINGMQVRLGIEAPIGVIVDREEIYQRRQRSFKDFQLKHYTHMAEQAGVQP